MQMIEVALTSKQEEKEQKLQELLDTLQQENADLKWRMNNPVFECIKLTYELEQKMNTLNAHKESVAKLENEYNNVQQLDKWKEESKKEVGQLEHLQDEIDNLKNKLLNVNHAQYPVIHHSDETIKNIDDIIVSFNSKIDPTAARQRKPTVEEDPERDSIFVMIKKMSERTVLGIKVALSSFCIILFLLSGFYFYYLTLAASVLDITALAIYAISLVIIMAIIGLGLFATYKEKISRLNDFSAINLLLFLLGVVQIALAASALGNCQTSNSPFIFICSLSYVQKAYQFWLPTALIMMFNILCSIFSVILAQNLKKEIPDTVRLQVL